MSEINREDIRVGEREVINGEESFMLPDSEDVTTHLFVIGGNWEVEIEIER